MRKTFKFIALASVLFCVFARAVKAEDSAYTYTIGGGKGDLTVTLRSSSRVAAHNGIRYYRAKNSYLDMSAKFNDVAPANDGYYYFYMTSIQAYDEETEKVILTWERTDSFSMKKFLGLSNKITVTVLIEYFRRENIFAEFPLSIFPPQFMGSNQFSIRYHEDNVAPVMTITHKGKPIDTYLHANQSPIELIASAVDEGSGVDEGTWIVEVFAEGTVYGNQVYMLGSKDNRYVIFQVYDRVGNSDRRVMYAKVDQTDPKVNITTTPSAEWANESGMTITASGSDPQGGVDSNTWQYSMDGGKTWSAEGKIRQVSIADEGLHDVHFRVKDMAGNMGANSIIRGIDKTPPALEVKGDWGDAWSANPQETLEIIASDELSGMLQLSYHDNNSSSKNDWRSLGSSLHTNFEVKGEGRHSYTFYARDWVGNATQASANVNIDSKAPYFQAYINSPTYINGYIACAQKEGNNWALPVYVYYLQDTGSGVDYDSFKYKIDGGAWTKAPGSFSGDALTFLVKAPSLSEGVHAMTIAGADKVGNATEQNLEFYIDLTPPLITGGPFMGDTVDGAPWASADSLRYGLSEVNLLDALDFTVKTVLANGYLSPFSGYSYTGRDLIFNAGAPDGKYQIVIRATDSVGNSSEKTLYCRLDRTPPDISPLVIKSASRSVTIRGTDASSGLNYSNCWTSELAGVSGAAGYTLDLPNGFYEKEFTLTDIAGNSVTKKVAIYVDTRPPTVTVTAGEYAESELPVSINITSAVLGISNVWQLLDGVETELVKTSWNSVTIPLGSLSEGPHTVRFVARNEAGVSGESAVHQFVVDRTAPELTGYELRDAANPGRVILEGEYISGGAVLAKIAGTDQYKNGAGKDPGVIRRYSWAVTQRLSEQPVFSSARQSADREFTVQNFSEGLNYLCVYAEDGAGNESRMLRIPVWQDQSVPGAPVVKSSTHAEASRAEQAGFLSRAEFSFAPAREMKSGIKGYQWRIEKLYVRNGVALEGVLVREGETAEIDQEGKGGLSVELEDNDEDEFYQALARCVGGNGKEGAWTSYRFRIDSEPPGGLMVQTVPQADGSSWLNQGEVLVRWNKPSDMTGVAEYRHIILDEEETLASPLEGRDPSSWGKTADTQMRVNLRGIGGAKKSGKLRIGVSAVDYAGNAKLGQLSFGYDFIPPQFKQGALVIADAENAMGAGKRIRWGSILDGESGPDRVVILVSNGDRTSAYTVAPELTEYVVSPLEENKAFTVVVRAYDRAGNQAELYDVCATGNAAIPSVYVIPYLETINGYDLAGKKRIQGAAISFEDITLRMPESLELFAVANSNGAVVRNPLEAIPLEDISGSGGIFEAGRSGGGIYELRSGGFALEASGIAFSRGGGLDLENAAYVRPVLVDGVKQDRKISLGAVNAGNPPLMQFSSGPSAIGAAARIESAWVEDSAAAGELRSGFALTGVDSLFLSDGREWFGGAGISFDRAPLNAMGIGLESGAGEAALKNSSVEADSRNLAALLDTSAQKPLTLAMGDSVYRVNRAGIRGSLLDIYEAVLPLPPGYEPAELTVRNITIDTHTKTVRQGPDFSAGTVAVTIPGGAVFEGTMIRLDSRGNLLVTGYIDSQIYGIYRAEDIPLSGAGIDWDAGAEIREFSAEVHGFMVSAPKARVTGSGILIPEGKIELWGGQQTVAGLGLRNDRKDAVWKDGIIGGTFSGDPGYGREVQLSGGKVAGGGVFADALIPIGEAIVDSTGAKNWTLPQAQLHPNFVMTGSFAGEKTLVVAGATVRAEDCSFDEWGLRIGKASVEHIPHLSPGTAAFTGMAVNYRGVSLEGVAEYAFVLAVSGWELGYGSLGFDGRGIKGRGSLALPEKLGGFPLVFPETRIAVDGSFVCEGPEAAGEIIRFQGLPVFAGGAALKVLDGAHVLELVSPGISLKSINGPDIFFGKTIFNSEGKVLLGDNEDWRVDFTSFNGYRIGLEHCRIDDEGFSLEGVLSLELFGREVEIPGGAYRILPDLSVRGTGAPQGLVYAAGDWSVRGSNIVFDADRIRIGANRVLFRELEFDLGEIPLSPDGRLLERVVKQQGLGVSLFGAGAKIAETRFSGDGIEASVVISLPAVLGGKSFVFDRVGFRANGEFWVEERVDKFDFTALGFSFATEDLTMDRLGLKAAKTSITLPASMESVSFTVQDLTISASGEVAIGNAQVSPFTLWNMNFDLNNFSVSGGEASFQGKVSLPPALPGALSGRAIQIRDFRASLGGGITALDVFLEGDYRVPFSDAWSLQFSNVRVGYAEGQPWVSADRTELLFPQEYGARNAYIDHAKFNPLTGQFVFSEIAFGSEIPMNFWGVEFTLNRLKIDSQFSLEFGGSVRFPDSGLPAFIAGKTAAFNRFQIKSDGTLGEIDVKLEGLEGALVPGFDGLTLKKGSVTLLKEGAKSLILNIGGSIALDKSMPAGLAGATLKLETFSYDTAAREIKRLKATATLPSVSSLGNLFTKLTIAIDWNEVKQTGLLNLGGNLIFPASFPAFLAGREAKISNFKIGFDGVVQSFTAKYTTEKNKAYDAFGFLQLSDVAIEAALKSGVMRFDLAGTVILPEDKFPQGIGGVRSVIAMEFDTESGLKTASAQMKMGNTKLFGSMQVHNGIIGISKPEGRALEISLGGSVVLPSFFPQGLRGVALAIRTLTINTSGEILDVDIGVSGMRATIFGTAELSGGVINFKKGVGNEFLVDIGGSVRLVGAALPAGLKNAELEIRSLELSTKDGLRSFDAGVKGEVAFSVLGGVSITVSSLALGETGMSMAASAKLPANYPEGLANAQFHLSALELGWNGKLLDIKGGLKSWSMTLVGFTASIDELYFDKDTKGQFWVTLKSCKLQIPKNFGSFGGQYVAIKNAKFSPVNGGFLGDIEVSKIETEIAGFKLTLDKPSISFSENLINFSKATLKLPDFLSKTEITLKKVILSAGSGLKVSGGAFKLPGFNVGLFAFSNVAVDFSLSGSQYALEGGGSVLIPGAGNISASVAFATKSDIYPIGLKRAEFSYVASLGGIPLGATGLVVNGISGGISYGPPTEVPGKVQGLFEDKGPRMKVGLRVGDSKGGSIIDMAPTTWVDLTNGSWAFQGQATVLRGVLNITADVVAGLGTGDNKGFMGDFYMDIGFARGGVTVYVFKKSGDVIMSGEGHVEFGIPRGYIISKWFLKIPSSDLWLGRVNAAFGRFTNGRTGAKGWVSLPVLGSVGIYVGTGGLDVGSLSSYEIERPNWSKNVRFFDNGGIDSYDNRDSSGNEDTTCQFFVPPRGESIAAPLSLLHEEYDGNEEVPGSGLDRLIVVLEYPEGAPELTVVSPSGIEYREGSEGCETFVEEHGVVMAVLSAEAGIWQLRVRGLEEDAYHLSALGSMAMPHLELEEPSLLPEAAPQRALETARVRGRTEKGVNSVRVFARESKELPGFDLGSYAVDGEGRFDLTVPLGDLGDGEYLIYAELDDGPGAEFSPPAYAPGTILLDRSELPMLAPLARVAETDDGILSLRWENTNAGRSQGYKVKILDRGEGAESILYAGNITALDFPGYTPEQEVSFSVAALDRAGLTGPWSEPVSIRPGQEKPLINRPIAASTRVEAKGFSGGFIEGVVRADIADFRESADSTGYVGIRYAGPAPERSLNLHFDPPVKVEGRSVELSWRMGLEESMGPGLYEYPCEFFNEANAALNSPFVLAVELNWPDPEVFRADPDTISGIEETVLAVHGNGFVPGTRVFWRDEELVILDSALGSLRVKAPPRFSPAEAQKNETAREEFVVQGPGDSKTVFPVTVLLPSYKLSLYARTAEILPGGKADYALAAESLNGFEGRLSFRAVEKPEGLEIVLPEFALKAGADRAAGILTIQAGKDIRPGSYTVVVEGDGGKRFELTVTVRSEQPPPAIASVIPRAAYTGGTVHVYGNNFGGEGKLLINNRETPVLSWSAGEIVFVVPGDALSGPLHVLAAGIESNALSFTVKDRGFELRPATNLLEIAAGEEKSVPLVVTGHGDAVVLSVVCEPGAPFAAALSGTVLKPNEPASLVVKADGSAVNGSWGVAIRGESQGFEASAEIRVVIGSSLSIVTGRLPDALVDVAYHAELASRNARGALDYRVARGDLPPGLSLSARGVISGRPAAKGRYQMDIEARDSLGWKDKRSFTIDVWEESWGQAGKDGGHSRSVRTDLPARADTAWVYKGGEPVSRLLGAEDRIIALAAENIFALNAGDGSLSWKAKGAYRTMLYAGTRLYALAEGGRLEVRDPRNGVLLWTRDGIEAISSDGSTVIEETVDRRFIRNAERGTLIQEQGRGGKGLFPTLWQYGSAYAMEESALVPIYGPGKTFDAGERILAAAADIRGGAALTEKSLVLFDRDMTETLRIPAAHRPGATLSLTYEGVSVWDGGQLRSYDREDLRLQWTRRIGGGAVPANGAVLGNGLEKTIVAGGDGLTALNRYTGGVIWREEKPHTNFALYHGKIFAADAAGSIAAFNGPPNIAGPVTELSIDPPSPGESLWYTRQPELAITSVDRETYAAQILMRHNSSLWTDAPPTLSPGEGEHYIAVYGVDTRGVAGAEARLQFRVDTGLPESDITVSPEGRENGWHNGPVTLALDAWDEVSGIDWVWTSLSAYTGPVILSAQGTHRFSWQAVDRAGNREELRELEIKIDLEPPVAEASTARDQGLAELTLSAVDTLSGVAFIEYRINDGPAERYGEPLWFAEPGNYHVRYRAFDQAGNGGDWQSCDITIP
ncbi:MAG: PQQ-binding-like beta-propeller repeat protein, partial [Spirochaetaceae bacterium]|nr:PQQ-binding-like beta-propeller repeat protein [Spirochaetaceae bacterium]